MRLSTWVPGLCFSFLASFALAAEDDFVARAVSVSGKVLARGEGAGNVQMAFLKPGDKLYKGAIVNTGSNGTVKLLMTDRTILDLGPSSLFKVNEYQLQKGQPGDRKVDLSLDYGTVRASVNEKLSTSKAKFTIRTKAATMGVRGTEFIVNAPIPLKNAAGVAVEPPKMSITVVKGKVDVADPSAPAGTPPIAVSPGAQYAKSGDGPGKVAQLPPPEVAKVKSDAFQKDMTFLQTVAFEPSSTKSSKEESAAAKTETKPALAEIGTALESQAKDAPPTMVGDLKLPGTFSSDVPQARPIDQMNGRLVNLRVRICTSGSGC